MKRISINGKEYPCRITMGAMMRFKNETGKDVSKMDTTDVTEQVTLLWCCIVSASKADGVEFGIGLMDFADMLDSETLTGFYTSMEKEEGADPEKKTGQPTS